MSSTCPNLNHLLTSLPLVDYARISNHMRSVPFKKGQVLQKRGELLRDIYFPSRSLCALVMTMADGATAEIAVVGAEGLIGVEAVLGLSRGMADAIVQVTGDGVCQAMSIEAFRRECDRQEPFHSSVMKYAQAFVGFIGQSVACNGLHSADARCCRWLLQAQDRLVNDEFSVTHELLAARLALRRPTVTLVIADLVQMGIISTSRGSIRITDRAALEARACECYSAVKRDFDRLLAVPPATTLRATDASGERSSALAL